MLLVTSFVFLATLMASDARERFIFDPLSSDSWYHRYYQSNQTYLEQCMGKIIEEIQPCSLRAVSNWNLNHSLFVPSKMSTCCANWQVYDCFVQASLEYCSLLEFQTLVLNMTIDALALQRTNCSRFKYHSEVCTMFNGGSMRSVSMVQLASCGSIALICVVLWRM